MASGLYKHILVATDLAEHCGKLLTRAADIKKLTKAKLSIAHVLPHALVPYAGEFSIPIDAELEATVKKQTKKHLGALSKKYDIDTSDQYLLEGSVKIEITELAKKINADLIVVGTHSHEGLEVLLGSQANAILHAAPCDVWVIRMK